MRAIAFLLGVALFTVLSVVRAIRWSWVVARPDEWLLRIRDGVLVRSGIGISVWRRPGDVVVRYTSAVQRVTFSALAPSREQVPFATPVAYGALQ